MPQATDELREEWFDEGDERKAIKYLESQGYTLTNKFEWIAPQGKEPEPKELRAIDFLFQEFDFGGIVNV